MDNTGMYILGLVGFTLVSLFVYKKFFITETSSSEKLVKTNMEVFEELVKIMNNLMEKAEVDKAKFSEYLHTHNINPLKLWSVVKKNNVELDFQTQLSLFGDEFNKIITEFMSNGGFF